MKNTRNTSVAPTAGAIRKARPWQPPVGSKVRREINQVLSTYFHDVAAARPALRPEEEARLTREIEKREIDVWERLLAHPGLADFVLRLLERDLVISRGTPGIASLRRAATLARRQRTRAAQARLLQAARPAAARIRAGDRDRHALEAVLETLERVHGGEQPPLPGLSPAARGSRSLGVALAEARHAEQVAARARNVFIEANLRLVITMAHRFRGFGLSFSDLIQEGNLGLIKAVDRFDPGRELRFSTYASWWIRHHMTRALQEKSRSVRVPVHVLEASRKVARVRRELTGQLGRAPTAEEVALASGYSRDKLETLRAGEAEQAISLDQPIGGEEDGRQRMETFRDPAVEAPSPLEELTRTGMAKLLREVVKELDPKELDIIRKRFALDGGREWTLQEIGQLYSLSRERIRQIEERTLARLRRRIEQRENRAA